jgi:uncharacterized protein with GYD domain
MSALGHKLTWRLQFAMSALPPKADIVGDIDAPEKEHQRRFVVSAPSVGRRQHKLTQQSGKTAMATYVVLATFTDQGVKNAKDSPKRAEAFRQMAETFGVTVKDIFWTQGRYDIVIIIEAPDELSATALNLSLSALGNIRTESLRAFSSADMLKIVAKML